MDAPEGALAFQRVREPNEGAFSLLPHGWQGRQEFFLPGDASFD